jgi:hypothetical protein
MTDDRKKIDSFNLPFREAEDFFRAKLNIPTEKWDDIWHGEHAKGFMTAGAMKADLLADFRGAVQKSIDGGMSLGEFRETFDEIVAKHGWSYNGGRNWRSRLIYDTNITTAYQAGRWKQFVEGAAEALKYIHMDGVLNPRIPHVKLHGTVRLINDPFWDIHYGPNGWGCHCRAVRADADEVTEVPAAANDPKTVDPGWRYNVGKEGLERSYDSLTRKLENMPYEIGKQLTQSWLESPAFRLFYDRKVKTNFPVAVLDSVTREALGAEMRTVWFSPDSLARHLDDHPDIGFADYRKIQKIMDEGEVYKQVAGRIIYLKLDGKLYRAAVKTTVDKRENFFLTLFETSDGKALAEVRSKYEKVR